MLARLKKVFKTNALKKLLLTAGIAAIVGLGTATVVYGPSIVGSTLTLQPWTVASLPTASANTNRIFEVHDGLNADDCKIGGGSTTVHCESNGSQYYSLSAGRNLRIRPQDFGVDITGSTDSTTEVAAMVAAACPGWNGSTAVICGTIELPNHTQIKVSQINLNQTVGFRMTGGQSQGEGVDSVSAYNAEFIVTGGTSPFISLYESRDSELDHFSIWDPTGVARVEILWDMPNSGATTISTNNYIHDVTITAWGQVDGAGSDHLAGFIAMNMCPSSGVNCENFKAHNITIACGQGYPGPHNGGYTIPGSGGWTGALNTFIVGETVTQAVSGAHGTYYGPTNDLQGAGGQFIVLNTPITGLASATTSNAWVGNTSGATYTPNAKPVMTDSGIGLLIGSPSGGGGGQPFSSDYQNIDTVNCSQAIVVNAADTMHFNGGLTDDYSNFVLNEGVGVVYENFRSEYATAPIVINGGRSIIKNYVVGAQTNYTNSIFIAQGEIRVVDSDWEGYNGNNHIMPIATTFGNGNVIVAENNNFSETANCPVWGNFSFASSEDNTGCTSGKYYSTYSNARQWLLNGADKATGVGEPSIFLGFGTGNGGGSTDYTYGGVVTKNASPNIGNYSYLSFSYPSYPTYGTLSFTLPPVSGGLNTTVLPTPVIDTVSQSGTAGTTHYTYTVTTWDGQGHTAASTGVTVTNGNATLSYSPATGSGNCNVIQFSDSGMGAWYYTIRRTASGGTPSSTGVITLVWPYQNTGLGYTVYDCGSTGDSTSAETTNTTGYIMAAMGITLKPQLFSAYPACAAGTEGMTEAVTDSTTSTWGATVTGTGTPGTHILMYCDGTNWTVAAK